MEKYCVLESYTIKEVMEVFEGNHERVAIVVNDNRKVTGVVSQGDIIRGLASGVDMYIQVSAIIRPSFLYLQERDMEKAYKIFRDKKITLLPVVSRDYKLVDTITLNDIFDYLEETNVSQGK